MKRIGTLVSLAGLLVIVSSCDVANQPASGSAKQPSLVGSTLVPYPTAVEPIISLRIVGLNRGSTLEIWGDGLAQLEEWGNMAGVRSGESTYSRTTHFPTEQMIKLIAQFREAGFFDMQDKYIEQDPPGQIIEMDYVHITFRDGGRTKEIKIRGSSGRPIALINIQDALFGIQSNLERDITPSATP